MVRFDRERLRSEAWVSVTYEGEELFHHPEAGVFRRGTRTCLRGELAVRLAEQGQFSLRKAG